MTLSPLRVAPSGRYFETSDNEPFLFIGANDAISWPGLNGLFRRRDMAGAEAYLRGLADNGINTLRLMLEYAHHDGRYFERRVGTFNPLMVRLWDDLFGLCDKFGLRILLAPWDNFWMAYRWKKHPYNVLNGGPAQNSHSFFTDEATIAAVENRLRFVARRWGGHGSFGAWDLFNEIHPYWGGSVEDQSRVLNRWSKAIREEECATWGWSRPQTVSVFGPEPNEYSNLVFGHPDLDFATTHIYNKGDIDFPHNTVAPALAMAQWTRFGLNHTPPNRPFTDSEHGPIHLFNDHKKYLDEAFDNEYERHLMWAHLASGGCGSGMRWPARHPHVITEGMKRALGHLAAFVPLLDWRHFSPREAIGNVEVAARDVHVFACADGKQALLWLLRGVPKSHKGTMPQREPLRDVRVIVSGLKPIEYSIALWNTHKGVCEGKFEAQAHETLSFTLPQLGDDLAIAIRPLRHNV